MSDIDIDKIVTQVSLVSASLIKDILSAMPLSVYTDSLEHTSEPIGQQWRAMKMTQSLTPDILNHIDNHEDTSAAICDVFFVNLKNIEPLKVWDNICTQSSYTQAYDKMAKDIVDILSVSNQPHTMVVPKSLSKYNQLFIHAFGHVKGSKNKDLNIIERVTKCFEAKEDNSMFGVFNEFEKDLLKDDYMAFKKLVSQPHYVHLKPSFTSEEFTNIIETEVLQQLHHLLKIKPCQEGDLGLYQKQRYQSWYQKVRPTTKMKMSSYYDHISISNPFELSRSLVAEHPSIKKPNLVEAMFGVSYLTKYEEVIVDPIVSNKMSYQQSVSGEEPVNFSEEKLSVREQLKRSMKG